MNELGSEYLQRLLLTAGYNLRKGLRKKFSPPEPNTNYLKRSICYSGVFYGMLCPEIEKILCSVGHFKQDIKRISDVLDSYPAVMKTVLKSFSSTDVCPCINKVLHHIIVSLTLTMRPSSTLSC